MYIYCNYETERSLHHIALCIETVMEYYKHIFLLRYNLKGKLLSILK